MYMCVKICLYSYLLPLYNEPRQMLVCLIKTAIGVGFLVSENVTFHESCLFNHVL